MDEPRDALVLLEAERGEHAAVIRVPLGDPGRAIAERVRGEHEAHGDGAGRQHLLPFRNLHMRRGAADHRDDERCAHETDSLACGYLAQNAATIASPAASLASPSNTMKRQGTSLP